MSLSTYTQPQQSALFEKLGAFFAFSQSQYHEARKAGVKYVGLGSGLVCPESNASALIDGLDAIQRAGIAQDIAENGLDAIIKRELYNYECFYTGDISDAVEALSEYGVSASQVKSAYAVEYANVDERGWY